MTMLAWFRKLFAETGAAPSFDSVGVEISAEENTVVYAIGDIHGRFDLLRLAESKIIEDIGPGSEAVVVYLGDYIDRGPESRGVLEHLRAGAAPNFRRICLRGNHDESFRRFLETPLEERGWLELGGKQTLRSYGLSPDLIFDAKMNVDVIREFLDARVPRSHREFLSAMPHWARFGDYVFVHAGLQPGVKLEEQEPNNLMWIREPFLSSGPKLPFTVIHGHTPGQAISYGPNRIGIDTGAYATGILTVLKVTKDGTKAL
jgi:serine/threonine protein phosphatase 1